MNNENNVEFTQEELKNIQIFLQELLLIDDIEGERKLLQKYGIDDVNERSLESFHKKKEELFTFVMDNRETLSKLTVEDLENVNSGDAQLILLTYQQLVNAFGKGAAVLIDLYLNNKEKNIFKVISSSIVGSMCVNVLCYLFVNKLNKDVFADLTSKKKR